jgi:hypothetical protein
MKYKLVENWCRCHPETCNCNDWLILKDDERFVTIFNKETAEIITEALNFYDKHKGDK